MWPIYISQPEGIPGWLYFCVYVCLLASDLLHVTRWLDYIKGDLGAKYVCFSLYCRYHTYIKGAFGAKYVCFSLIFWCYTYRNRSFFVKYVKLAFVKRELYYLALQKLIISCLEFQSNLLKLFISENILLREQEYCHK